MSEILKTDLYQVVEARHGRFLCNPNDIYIGRSVIEYGEFSELEWHMLDQLIQPGMLVIEAGSNMGAHTVPIAKKVGINGLVYAFEPQIAIFQQLCANLALNDLVNVQAFNAGCGETPDWMQIVRVNPSTRTNYGGFQLKRLEGAGQTRIRIEKLDEALDPPRLDLLKADVEGMEVEVLKGAAGLIAEHRPLLYVEANAADAPRVIAHVQELDYDMWWHLPMMFNPNNHAGKEENLFSNITSKNILCSPSERKLKVQGARAVTGPEDHPSKWKRVAG
jgi:FkbM family methyltransferase